MTSFEDGTNEALVAVNLYEDTWSERTPVSYTHLTLPTSDLV